MISFHEAVRPLLVPLDSVRRWPKNPRSGDLAALKESLRENGMYQPVVAQDSTGFIIAGNHRHQALEELGESQIPVVRVDVDDTRAAKIALADNRTSDLAFYDDGALFDLLTDLMAHDSLLGTGYDRQAYELLLQGRDGDVTGGVRQGMSPDERLAEYNALDIRSFILPYEAATYETVAEGFSLLRKAWALDSNADVAERLVTEAVELLDAGAFDAAE